MIRSKYVLRLPATNSRLFWRITLILCCLLLAAPNSSAAAPASPITAAPFELASQGKVTTQIVIAPAAGETVVHVANALSQKLEVIFGVKFDVVRGDGTQGIAIGMDGDFPAVGVAFPPVSTVHAQAVQQISLKEAQRYNIRTHEKGVALIGASELAVEYAMWDFLNELGYRHFFPHEVWEVIPDLKKQSVTLMIDRLEVPDYLDRRIWYGWGGDGPRKYEWNFKNRMNNHGWRTDYAPYMPDQWKRTFIQTQHVYGAIYTKFKSEFVANPQYMALIKGERKGHKLCLSNPAVRKIAIQYALDYFKQIPNATSLSMEPTDGYGWCECEPCAALGSPSTRMIGLANDVAHALETDWPDKFVGVLAYAQHAEAPASKVHPRVVVACATQLSGSIPIAQRLKAWGEKVNLLGVYDYYAVAQWHNSMPGRMRGGDIGYLKQTVPEFHELGAQVMVAESSDCWGPNGLGYYVASKILWNTSNAQNTDAIITDFLTKAFGPAANTMKHWYDLMDNSQNINTAGKLRLGSLEYFEDRFPRMYSYLLAASEEAKDRPDIQARLDQLFLYTRVVELWCNLKQAGLKAKGETPQAVAARSAQALERLMRFCWQIHDTGMAHWQGMRGAIAGASKVDTKGLPSWVTADPASVPMSQRNVEWWQAVTPDLIQLVRDHAREFQRVPASTGVK